MLQTYIRSVLYFNFYLFLYDYTYKSSYMLYLDFIFILFVSLSEFYFLINKKFYKFLII